MQNNTKMKTVFASLLDFFSYIAFCLIYTISIKNWNTRFKFLISSWIYYMYIEFWSFAKQCILIVLIWFLEHKLNFSSRTFLILVLHSCFVCTSNGKVFDPPHYIWWFMMLYFRVSVGLQVFKRENIGGLYAW